MIRLGQSIVRLLDLTITGVLGYLEYAIVILGWVEFGDLVVEVKDVAPEQAL